MKKYDNKNPKCRIQGKVISREDLDNCTYTGDDIGKPQKLNAFIPQIMTPRTPEPELAIQGYEEARKHQQEITDLRIYYKETENKIKQYKQDIAGLKAELAKQDIAGLKAELAEKDKLWLNKLNEEIGKCREVLHKQLTEKDKLLFYNMDKYDKILLQLRESIPRAKVQHLIFELEHNYVNMKGDANQGLLTATDKLRELLK